MSSTISSKASSGVKWTAIRSLIIIISGVVQVAVLGRLLTSEDFGAMALLTSIIGVANVFVQAGFSDALIAKDDADRAQLATLYWVNIGAGIFLFLLLVVCAPVVSIYFKYPDIETMLRVIAVVVIIAACATQFEALMKKRLLFRPLSIIQSIAACINTTVAIVAASYGAGAWSLVYGMIVNHLVIFTGLFFYAVKNKWLPEARFSYNSVLDFIQFGMFRVGAALLNQLNSRADQFVIGFLLGPSALGYYSVAYQLVMQPFSKINPILTHVSFPIFAAVKHDNERILRGYRKGLRTLTAINAPILVGIAAIAPQVVPLLLGEGWTESVLLVQILSFYVIFRSAGNVSVGVILAKGKYKWPLYWNFILLCIIPLAIYSAANIYGTINAVAWMILAVQIALTVMNYILYIRTLLRPKLLPVLLDFAIPLSVASLMGGTVVVFDYFFASGFSLEWLRLSSDIVLGIFAYVVLSLILQKQVSKDVLSIMRSTS